ncbi:MAG: VanZ family protein [Gammaproteobacteria bacterium]
MLLNHSCAKVLFWAFAFTVLILSAMPGSVTIRHSIEHLDKLGHFAAFFLLSILLLFAYKLTKPFFTTALIMALFGFSIELLHLYIPRRVFSMYDFAADLLGVVVALIFYRIFCGKFKLS